MTESARCTDAGMHSAEARAASMSAAETAVSTGMTACVPTGMSAAVAAFSPGKRRGGCQQTHDSKKSQNHDANMIPANIK